MHTRNHASCRVQDTMSLGCPDFFTKPLTIAVIPQDPTLPATLSRRAMVKSEKSKKSKKHESIDSTLKTLDTKQTTDKTSRDVKQQALFMKKKAPLSYLMESMNITNGTFSMASMQADVFFT